MEIIRFNSQIKELPLKVLFSLEHLYREVEKYLEQPSHAYHEAAQNIFKKISQYPQLRSGIEDFDEIQQYEEPITMLTDKLFPGPLLTNEIKALMVPFQFHAFRLTTRFSNILKNAGEEFEMKISGFDGDNFYQMACAFILTQYYKQPFHFNRPLSMEIYDKNSGIMRHYRLLLNADFTDIIKTDKAPELTQDDINEMMLRGDDLDFWRSKMPPESYIFKGFGIMNLYDATTEVIISQLRTLFLKNDENIFDEFQKNLRILFGIKDLQVGYSAYNTKTEQVLTSFMNKESQSLFLDKTDTGDYHKMFCDGVNCYVLQQSQTLAIPDVDLYAERIGHNIFSKKLKAKGIGSILLAPIQMDSGEMQLLELASPRKYELNSLNAIKLQDVVPFVKIATQRFLKERENVIESTIQENYTSIHPSVKWRFTQAVNSFNKQKAAGVGMPVLEEIVFDKIYPLYGQSDIKGSSTARNHAIQADLEFQLSLVIDTLKKVMTIRPMPIYKKLIFRVNHCLGNVKDGLKAGDEVGILDFLKNEIYPVFRHLKTLGPAFSQPIEEYMSHIDPTLNVVYKERKAYEDSVTILNEKLSAVLDQRQEEAQAMFPHYFQRYNTDGVEYNIYIGDSILENDGFDLMYLYNLRLWQLETMWDIEQKAFELRSEMPHPLEVASLILIHSNPLAIKFMMDNKQFDVDGAYNARYEIIKKRIDKSHIKGTNDRLTIPGKIAIVYSQDKDAQEYLNYIEYLQAEGKFGEVEMLDVEDLQGVSGLKAIRVEVLYQEKKGKGEKVKLNGRQAAMIEA
ncbi:MAG: hypothetical protein R2788_01820 [Saprospiraceae bacterium]